MDDSVAAAKAERRATTCERATTRCERERTRERQREVRERKCERSMRVTEKAKSHRLRENERFTEAKAKLQRSVSEIGF